MIAYFGSKNKMVYFINKYIPRDIKIYCEPFSGAFWTYLNPNYEFPILDKIVYNDINKHLTNLFVCFKNYETFLNHIEYELTEGILSYNGDLNDVEAYKKYYRDLYYYYKQQSNSFLDTPPENMPDYKSAVLYLFLASSAFNGCYPRSAGFSGFNTKNKLKINNVIKKMKDHHYQYKLSKITDFHSDDFETIINKYDSEQTFFYLDPPYLYPTENSVDTGKRAFWYGTKEYNVNEAIRLINILKQTKARWALSHYYSSEVEKHLPKNEYVWVSEKFFRSSSSFSETKRKIAGEEILIMNYKLSNEEIEYNKQFFKNKK